MAWSRPTFLPMVVLACFRSPPMPQCKLDWALVGSAEPPARSRLPLHFRLSSALYPFTSATRTSTSRSEPLERINVQFPNAQSIEPASRLGSLQLFRREPECGLRDHDVG